MGAFLDWYGEARVKKKPSGETISLRHISRFPLPAWFIFFICMFFYIGVLTFYTGPIPFFLIFFLGGKGSGLVS